MSTSKTVTYGWTVVFASALVIMATLVVFGRLEARPGLPDRQQLGRLPAAARRPFCFGRHREGDRLIPDAAGPDPKSGTPAAAGTANAMSMSVAAQPFATDIVNGDSGTSPAWSTPSTRSSRLSSSSTSSACLSPISKKYAAGAVSAGTTAGSAEWLPQIPSALLGLTSLAALTYVGNKAVQTQGLGVVSFSPNPASPSNPVTAALANLPATATTANTTILALNTAGETQSISATAVDTTKNTVDFPSPAVKDTYSVIIAGPNALTSLRHARRPVMACDHTLRRKSCHRLER